jgi:hypothetical protein
MTRSITKSITTSLNINLGIACGCACLALTSARAVPIVLTVDPNFPPGTTPYVLGNVNPPEPASPADDVKYINAIIPLALGGSTTVAVPGGKFDTVYRSENSFGSLPTATTVGDMSGDTTDISLTTGFEYLVGKYDGPNGGLEVWDIASIAAGSTIDIPEDAFGRDDDQYGLSGWWLFTPSTGEVPDGGSTAMLLGLGFLGLGLLGRYFSPRPLAMRT